MTNIVVSVASIAVILFSLGGCDATQVGGATARIAMLCQDVLPLAGLASIIPEGEIVALGVRAACATDAGIAKLAADPSSAEWLNRQAAILRGLVKKPNLGGRGGA